MIEQSAVPPFKQITVVIRWRPDSTASWDTVVLFAAVPAGGRVNLANAGPGNFVVTAPRSQLAAACMPNFLDLAKMFADCQKNASFATSATSKVGCEVAGLTLATPGFLGGATFATWIFLRNLQDHLHSHNTGGGIMCKYILAYL